MNDFIFFFNFMGKAVCFANGGCRGKMQVGNPAMSWKTKEQ